jgi:hypothetical protein
MKAFKLFLASAVLFLSATACLSSVTDLGTQAPSAPTDVPQVSAPTDVPQSSSTTDGSRSASQKPVSSGFITKVVLAKDSDPVYAKPINPTTVFTSSSVIHAVIEIKNAPANTKFTASWYVVDDGGADSPNTFITSTDLTADGTRDMDFTLTPTSTWPAGTYRVDISVNGQLDQSATYTVK